MSEHSLKKKKKTFKKHERNISFFCSRYTITSLWNHLPLKLWSSELIMLREPPRTQQTHCQKTLNIFLFQISIFPFYPSSPAWLEVTQSPWKHLSYAYAPAKRDPHFYGMAYQASSESLENFWCFFFLFLSYRCKGRWQTVNKDFFRKKCKKLPSFLAWWYT